MFGSRKGFQARPPPAPPLARRVQIHADDGLRHAVAPFMVQRVVMRRDGIEGEELLPSGRWCCWLFALSRRRRRARLEALAGAKHVPVLQG